MHDLWIFAQAALLGLIEGFTEFLPVSSTGHLILFIDLLGFKAPPGKSFEIIIQFGAILAVLCVFWRKIFYLIRTLPTEAESRHFALALCIAFLPAMLVGALAHAFIKAHLFNPLLVCAMLVLGGLVMLWLERWRMGPNFQRASTLRMEDLSYVQAFKIGGFQCLAMVPGVSRSGATIMGALWLGLDKRTAAEFSFFLAIPTMLGATVFSLYKNWGSLDGGDWGLIGIGFIFAFAAALLVARIFIGLVTRYGFAPFAWYRIILGLGMLPFFI